MSETTSFIFKDPMEDFVDGPVKSGGNVSVNELIRGEYHLFEKGSEVVNVLKEKLDADVVNGINRINLKRKTLSTQALNSISALVKVWESKNVNQATRTGGMTLMAVSLAACGGSNSPAIGTVLNTVDDDAALAAAELLAESKLETDAAQIAEKLALLSQIEAEAAAELSLAAQIAAEKDAAAALVLQRAAEAAAATELTGRTAAEDANALLNDELATAIKAKDAAETATTVAVAAQDLATSNLAALEKTITDTGFADAAALVAAKDLAASNLAALEKTITDTGFADAAALVAAQDLAESNLAAFEKTITDAGFADAAALVAAHAALIAPVSFELTVSNDVPPMTFDNDQITGTDLTLTTGDVIADRSSTDSDTLTLTGSAFATAINTTNTTISGVESIVVNFDALTAATFNMAGVADAPSVTVSNVRAGSTAHVTVSNVFDGAVINTGTINGGLTVTTSNALATVADSVTVNSAGSTGVTTVTTSGSGKLTVNSGTDGVSANTLNAAIDINAVGAATGNITAASTGGTATSTIDIDADLVTGVISGTSVIGKVTVNADAATTVSALTTGASGTVIVDAAAATAINADGSNIIVSSENVGTAAIPTVITINGTATGAQTDTAAVSANGIVTLTNNVNLESTSLSGNTAAVTFNIGNADTFEITGVQNVTLSGTEAIMSAATVTETATGTVIANVTDAGTGADYSLVTADSINHAVAVGVGTYTYASGANVTMAANPAAINLDIDDDAGGTTTVGLLNLTLGADSTGVMTIENTADEIDTLNVLASVAQTALDFRADNTASTGDTVNLNGSVAIAVAATNTALSLDGSNMTGGLTATAGANTLSVQGGSGDDTLSLLTATANTSVDGNAGNDGITGGAVTYLATQTLDGGDGEDTFTAAVGTDVSDATFENFELITLIAGGTLTMLGSQITGLTVNVTGTNAANDTLTINGAAGTVADTISTANLTATSAGIFITSGAGADIITGGVAAESITGGAGRDVMDGGGGADIFIFAAGVTDTVATSSSIAGVDHINTADLNADTIDLTVAVAAVNTTVTGTLTEASFLADMQALLNVGGAAGFNTAAAGDISGAIVTANAGDLNGRSFIAVDLDANDGFTLTDFVVEVTGFTNTLAVSDFV